MRSASRAVGSQLSLPFRDLQSPRHLSLVHTEMLPKLQRCPFGPGQLDASIGETVDLFADLTEDDYVILYSRQNCMTVIDFAASRQGRSKIVSQKRFCELNFKLDMYLRAAKVRGLTKTELIVLSYQMRLADRGLLGDVIQMSPADVLVYAQRAGARNPVKLVGQLVKCLENIGLGLEMRAPGWRRQPRPDVETIIAWRESAALSYRRQPAPERAPFLRVVANSDVDALDR